ncbi:Endo-1-3(4)-beta-glucanase [Penicillium maclennaniae]|uniref:Endo-1-3(4)-beta-glucanase n=1 Tax=Penicillium maclennaniae TaxID=1343394 RepID=UPI002540B90B|nr:Endo-1-3(4)-beta-glucanase [Penicillium maclennaniae]KAJ5670485.1 Endo-1-3(4)-beta-glucanase [Penicillium maclennaniae]
MKQGGLSLGIPGGLCLLQHNRLLISKSSSQPPYPRKDLEDCDCFTVSGPDPGYFQHYKLWDFRAVPLGSSTNQPGNNNDEDDDEDDLRPDSQGHDGNKQEINLDILSFFQSTFNKDWKVQQWRRPRSPDAPVDMINSKHNVFITKNHEQRDPHATYLVLRTIRHDNYSSTAEIETRARSIYRCSIRVRFRILPTDVLLVHPMDSPLRQSQHKISSLQNSTISDNEAALIEPGRPPSGACVGIFTYRPPNCESDIEILTSDPLHRVRYANQPDYDPETDVMIPGASTILDLEVSWTNWSTHRLDWLSEVSRWWVNDKPRDAKTYRVPNMESRVVINLWSDGGIWTGDMRLGDRVYLGIEYIELAYNRSSDASKHIPPAQPGGHKQPFVNVSISEIMDFWEDSWGPKTEFLTGVKKEQKKKHGKCKKGKKGRKCRKKHHQKPKKPNKPKRPIEPHCIRACNIDDLHLGNRGVGS